MISVNIPQSDSITFKDFDDGNSVQVRVKVSKQEEGEYKKNELVKVIHSENESVAKIVSDPIVIDEKAGDGKKMLSLIIEKSAATL
jgi:hypothetical protein